MVVDEGSVSVTHQGRVMNRQFDTYSSWDWGMSQLSKDFGHS